MAVFDSTNVIDSSIHLKAKLDKNRVGENYYIQNLQDLRDRDWYTRYNVIGIEEELHKQTEYSTESPEYAPIDVVIRTVKGEKGQDLGTDWADLAFRDLHHPNELGDRYRFSTEFLDMSEMSEEEKYYNTSVWLAVNKNPVSAGNNVVVRRCNSNIALVGSPSMDYENLKEVHYEPVILENDLKFISMYYNMTVVIPQSEWYATMQLNYYTNCIKINDRVIFGGVSGDDRSNNAVFMVKAIVKAGAQNTFSKNGSAELDKIPICLLALDKDTISSRDNFYNRVADRAPMYQMPLVAPVYEYYITLTDESVDLDEVKGEPFTQRLLLTQEQTYCAWLMFNNRPAFGGNADFSVTMELVYKNFKDDNTAGDDIYPVNVEDLEDFEQLQERLEREEAREEYTDVPVEDEGSYYSFEILGNNKFSIKNLKACPFGILRVTCSCSQPGTEDLLEQRFYIELGGFY